MRLASLLSVLLLLGACTSAPTTDPPSSALVSKLAGPLQTTYDVWEDESGDLYPHETSLEPEPATPLDSSGARVPRGEIFRGTCRKKAKISFPSSTVKKFSSISHFLASLPSDEEMQDRNISQSAHSGRTPVERKVVSFPAFILASNKPKDNDYHVIVGDHPKKPSVCINVEVSGLPSLPRDQEFTTASQASKLEDVRAFYKGTMGSLLPTKKYKHYNPGIPVQIRGAAFYDSCHRPGEVGPAKWRPLLKTCWELHPVTFITFLPTPQ